MIYINRIFKRVLPEETYVLMDFDRTLTTQDSTISWGVIEDSPLVHPNLRFECKELYSPYREIEIDPTIEHDIKFKHMEEWVRRAVNIYNNYSLSEEIIRRTLENYNTINLRRDSKSFLERMKQLEIPVIITSAGAGMVIEDFLQSQGCNYDNIEILSNFFTLNNGIINGVRPPVIHSLNKNELDYSSFIEGRNIGILFGDQVEDIKTAQGRKVTKVGFCDTNTFELNKYNNVFDITLTDCSGFDNVGNILIEGYKIDDDKKTRK